MRAGAPRTLSLLVAAAVLVGCCGPGAEPTPPGEVVPGADRAAAPAFADERLGGGRLESGSLSGQVVVVNSWGSWCSPCRDEVPELQALSERTRADGVAVVGVVVEDQEQLARAFLDDAGVTHPSLSDADGEVSAAFADLPIRATPSTVLVDREGRVAAVHVGAVSAEDLSAAVGTLVGEDP